MPTPILSIITVCFCAREELRATLENVLIQTWKHFEYLVIDGDSGDGTKELLEKASLQFEKAEIPFRFVSEPDQGIYDAMNKGTLMAGGNWLLFLNAGDLLADSHVLEHIFREPSKGQILYGDTVCIYQNNQKLYPALPLTHLPYEMAFCHQSAFIRRELLLEHPYDITYRVCADHHFFLSMYLQNKIFDYRSLPVSIYEISGYSDTNKWISHQEKHRMQQELGIFRFSVPWLLREIRFYISQGVKTLLGQKFIDRVRRNRLQS